MALNIEAKKALVAEVNAIALTAHSAVAAESVSYTHLRAHET